MKAIKCDICPDCKKEMNYLYNDFLTLSFFGKYTEIRGQVCDNLNCRSYGIERRHPRQGEDMTKEEYKIHKKSL
jgi:hypothetical protein